MIHKFVIQSPAHRDLAAHVEFIAQDSVVSVRRFMDRFEETADKLALMPEMGRIRSYSKSELNEIRSFPIKGFAKFLIFYTPGIDGITIQRVLHSSRNIKRILKF